MSIYKRGDVYWYKFQWQGKLVRESTKQHNDKVARQRESAHRTRLANELDEYRTALNKLNCQEVARCPECGQLFDAATTIRDTNQQFCTNHCRDTWKRKHRIVPTLKDFCENRVEPWAKATFEHTRINNWLWFRAGIRRLTGYKLLAGANLDEITSEAMAGFVAHEQTRFQNRGKGDKQGLAVSSINSAIRVLRRALSLAVEWKVIDSAPTLSLIPGEQHVRE